MPRIRVESVTIYATHATVNGTSSIGNLPASSMNFNVSLDEAYSRTYEPGREYDFNPTLVPVATEPTDSTPAPFGAQQNQNPPPPAADVTGQTR